MNTFIQQGHIKLIKSDSKNIYCIMLQKNLFQMNTVILIKDPEKNWFMFTSNILSSTTVFNTDNKKCFLRIKSAY